MLMKISKGLEHNTKNTLENTIKKDPMLEFLDFLCR